MRLDLAGKGFFCNFVVGIMEKFQPALYLFPVGLSDVSLSDVLPQRNLDLLREIRYFVVENLRSARRFLRTADSRFPIDDCSFTELSEHTSPNAVGPMLEPLRRGEAIGVISEAGCPAVADPGADLVAAAQREGLPVIPLVGPSSILLALMGSGFNGQRFSFEGYLPIDEGERRRRLKEMTRRIEQERQTQIFIETPYRNNRLLKELTESLPGRLLLCVASDITGPRQVIKTLPLERWRREQYDFNKVPTIFLLYS